MKTATLYYNPSCSKSNAALQILEENGYTVNAIEYLNNMPSASTLSKWIQEHDIDSASLVRTGEKAWQQMELDIDQLNNEQIIEQLIHHPILLQRPIVCIDETVLIARPAEKILEIL